MPAVFTWSGAGPNPNWSTGANWVGGVAPNPDPLPGDPADDLIFPTNPTSTVNFNDFATGSRFSSIAIQGTGYNLNGNAIVLEGTGVSGGITSNAVGDVTVSIGLTFAKNPQAIATTQAAGQLLFPVTSSINLADVDLQINSQSTGDKTIAVGAQITGVGNIFLNKAAGGGGLTNIGQITFSPTVANTYTGTTSIDAGTLTLLGTGPGGLNVTIPGDLIVGDGISFNGLATVNVGLSEQIEDTANVIVQSDGILALAGVVETINDLTIGSAGGGGKVTSAGTGGGGATATLSLNGNLVSIANNTFSQIDPVLNLTPGEHTFTVELGTGKVTGYDLLITGPITGFNNSELTFAGNGRTELQGAGGTAAFPITVASGTVRLNNIAAADTGLILGDLTIGDGSGKAATVQVLDQFGTSKTSLVTINANGTYDLSGLTKDETIRGLIGSSKTGQVLLGKSMLIIEATSSFEYAGGVSGPGGITVTAANPLAAQTLSGLLNLSGTVFGTYSLIADAGARLIINGQAFGTGAGLTAVDGSGAYVSGIGSVQFLQLAEGTFLDPGLNPDLTQTAGRLSTERLDLPGEGIFNVRIYDGNNFGSVSINRAISVFDPGSAPILLVELPTGYTPQPGEAFTIIDILPVSVLFPSGLVFQGLDPLTNELIPLNEGTVFTAFNSRRLFSISYRGGDGNDVVIYDANSPTVTVVADSKSVVAATPTAVTYTATFSGAINTINPNGIRVETTGDVTFDFASSQRITDTVYRITVNNVTGVGTLTVSLVQGAAISLGGAPTQASLSPNDSNVVEVNIPVVPPVPPPPPPPPGGIRAGARMLVGAGAGGLGQVNVYQGQTVASRNLVLPSPQFDGGVRVATADFNGDGIRDYVFASGPGTAARVEVYDGSTGQLMFSAFPYGNFLGGLNVTTGDLTGDGIPELVIAPDVGGGPRVTIFSGVGFAVIADFFGIDDPNFRGGARVAVGDLNGDGFGDLAVAAGFGGGPRVALYDGRSFTVPFDGRPQQITADFFAFEPSLRNGVYVAIVDVNGDGFGDLITGAGPGGGPRVIAYNGQDLLTGNLVIASNFFAGNPEQRGGIRVAAVDFDGDGTLDLATGAGDEGGSEVRVYVPSSLLAPIPAPLVAFDAFPGFTNGVFVG